MAKDNKFANLVGNLIKPAEASAGVSSEQTPTEEKKSAEASVKVPAKRPVKRYNVIHKKKLDVYLPEAILNDIEAIAKKKNTTKSAVINELLVKALTK